MALVCPQLLPEGKCRVCVEEGSAAALWPVGLVGVRWQPAAHRFSRANPTGARNICHPSAFIRADFLSDLLAPVRMAGLRQWRRDCAAATLMCSLFLVSVCQRWCPL